MPPPDDFAATLKQARQQAGLSQSEVAARAGLTGSYVCLLESRRRPPPAAEVVSALARAVGAEEAGLQEKAAMARTPEPVRRRVLRLARERGRMRRSHDRILATTLFHVTRRPGLLTEAVAEALGMPAERQALLGRIAGRVRQIRTVEEAESRSGDLLREVPAREREALARMLPSILAAVPGGAAQAAPLPVLRPQADEDHGWKRVPVHAVAPLPGLEPLDWVHVDRRWWRPSSWFLRVSDDEGFPRVERGDLLLVHPRALPVDGDLVLVTREGRPSVRRFLRRDGAVLLEGLRPEVPPLRGSEDRLDLAGVIAWQVRPGRPTA